MDLLSSTFSSPNDPDGQNDIFWDQNSPMTKQLGKLLKHFYLGEYLINDQDLTVESQSGIHIRNFYTANVFREY